jgi:hypothetical protein
LFPQALRDTLDFWFLSIKGHIRRNKMVNPGDLYKSVHSDLVFKVFSVNYNHGKLERITLVHSDTDHWMTFLMNDPDDLADWHSCWGKIEKPNKVKHVDVHVMIDKPVYVCIPYKDDYAVITGVLVKSARKDTHGYDWDVRDTNGGSAVTFNTKDIDSILSISNMIILEK